MSEKYWRDAEAIIAEWSLNKLDSSTLTLIVAEKFLNYYYDGKRDGIEAMRLSFLENKGAK